MLDRNLPKKAGKGQAKGRDFHHRSCHPLMSRDDDKRLPCTCAPGGGGRIKTEHVDGGGKLTARKEGRKGRGRRARRPSLRRSGCSVGTVRKVGGCYLEK